MSDVAYVVIARFNGKAQVWRGGVFDTPEEARAEWQEHADNLVNYDVTTEFVEVRTIKVL